MAVARRAMVPSPSASAGTTGAEPCAEATPASRNAQPETIVVTKTVTNYKSEDGSITTKISYPCPFPGCAEVLDDLPALTTHFCQAHDVPLEPDAPSTSKKGSLEIRRVSLLNGQKAFKCPLCIQQFPLDNRNGVVKHLAQEHGRLVSFDNDHDPVESSEKFDELYQATNSHAFPRKQDVLQRMHVISLGCYCGVKFSIQHLGLGGAHMPFDWIRTTSAGIREFVNSDFQNFFAVATKAKVPNSGLTMTMYRSSRHSFWHDDIEDEAVRTKIKRRHDRFLALTSDTRDLFFVRSVTCTDELKEVDELYAVLCKKFGPNRNVFLVVVIDGQEADSGPILMQGQPGLLFYTRRAQKTENGDSAFCWAIASALDHVLDAPDETLGPAQNQAVLSVESLMAQLTPYSAGRESGFCGLRSFEDQNVPHFDVSR